MQSSFFACKNCCMLSIDFVKISNSIYRQVNISESGSISRIIDSAISGVWPIALRLFIVHVITYNINIIVFNNMCYVTYMCIYFCIYHTIENTGKSYNVI